MTSNTDSTTGLRQKLLNSKGEINDEILARIFYEDARNGLSRLDTLKGLHGLYGHLSAFYREHYFANSQNIDSIVKLLAMSRILDNSEDSKGVARQRPGNFPPKATNVAVKIRTSSRSDLEESRAKKFTQPAISKRSSKQGNKVSSTFYAQPRAFHDNSRDVQRKTTKPSTPGKSRTRPSGHPSGARPHRKNTHGSALIHPQQNEQARDREESATTLLSDHSSEGSVESEPIPPTKVERMKGGRGNRYTDDDKEYFANYLRWYLHTHPGISLKDKRSRIVKRLARKVPSHSWMSWNSYWRDNTNIVNEIDGDDGGETDHSVDTKSDAPSSTNRDNVSSTSHTYGLRGRKESLVAKHGVSESASSDSDDNPSEGDSIVALPAPLCSPTPPTEVGRSCGEGNMYTDDEKVYFIQFLKWWMKKYPDEDINSIKRQFLDALHDNVPSHSAKSWGNHWRTNQKIVDQIIANAKVKVLENSSDNDGATSSSLSLGECEADVVEAGDGNLPYLDRPFNQDECHALAKRIASEGSLLAWVSLPEEVRWENIRTAVHPQQPNFWSNMFKRADKAMHLEIEHLVRNYIARAKNYRESAVWDSETECLIYPDTTSWCQWDGALDPPSATGTRPGTSGKRESPHSGPSHSQSVKKTRV